MPINVAQLNILVTADTASANASLTQINSLLAASAQQAAGQAAAMTQGSAQSTASIQQVSQAMQAQAAQTAAAASSIANSLNTIQQRAASAGAGVSSMGLVGSRSISTMNQAMVASGQTIGPFNQGLSITGTLLAQLPGRIDMTRTALFGLAAAMSGVAVVVANLNAKQVMETANLQTALEDSGKDWSDYADVIQKAIDKGAGWGYTEAQVEHSLSTLMPFLHDQNKVLEAFNVVSDVAHRRGVDLSTATDMIARGFGGTSRGLRLFTADLDLVADAEKRVTTLTQQLAAAQDQLADAQRHVTQIKSGPSNVAEQAAVEAERLQQALLAISRAQQDYADLQDRIAARDAGPQVDHLAAATAHLAEAQARLNELQNQQHTAALGGSRDELEKLAQASDKVLDAQQRMADAQGGDIITAQNSLRAAVEQQRKALDDQYQKQQQIIVGSAQDISAKEAVRKAVEELAIAQYEAWQKAHGQTAQQLADDEQLRHSQEAIADAIEAVARLRLEEAAKAASGSYALVNATDSVADAQQRVNDLQQKLLDAQNAQEHNVEEVLKKVGPVVAGASDAMASTWKGMLDRMIADAENFLADFGGGAGKWAAMLLPVITNLMLIRSLMSGSAVAGVAGSAAEVAAGTGLAGSLAALSEVIVPILAVVAAVAILAGIVYLLYQNWDAVASFLADTWEGLGNKTRETWSAINAYVADRLHDIVNVIKHLPERVADLAVDMKNVGIDAMHALGEGAVTEVEDKVIPFFQALPSRVRSALSDLYGIMYDVGHDMIAGLWNGVIDVWNGVMAGGGEVVGFFRTIVKDINDFIKRSSPSRLFHDIGSDMMLGLHEGIEQASAIPQRTMRDAMNKMVDTQGLAFKVGGDSAVGGLAGRFVPQAQGAVHYHYETKIDAPVSGNVISEKDLAAALRDRMVDAGKGEGGNYFGGYAGPN